MYSHLPLDKRPKPKRTRDSEIALLEKLSTSLDTYIGDNPTSTTLTTHHASPRKKKKWSAINQSQDASKNFLSAKTLAKSIAKACAQEEGCSMIAPIVNNPVVELLVQEYKHTYPALTKKLLVDGIIRYNTQHDINVIPGDGDVKGGEEEDANDSPHKQRLRRIVSIVNVDMNEYHKKIEALKKSRRESEPSSYIVNEKRGRPKGERLLKDTPENNLFLEIVKQYGVARARQSGGRLPNGCFEAIVEDTKRNMKMEHIDLGSMSALDKKVRFKYNKSVDSDTPFPPSQLKIIEEEIYARYERTKLANGDKKLPPGTLNSIIDVIKLENAISPDVNMASLKQKIQARFTKVHPEFGSSDDSSGQLKIGELSPEQKKRRQTLVNEVTARYVKAKGEVKKLPDGTLDEIIKETKNE